MAPPVDVLDNICHGLPGCGGCVGGVGCSYAPAQSYPALGSSTESPNTKEAPLPSATPIFFNISGNGEAYDRCGEVRKTIKCPNGHNVGMTDSEGHQDPFMYITNNCNRPQCPTCYEQWAARLARRSSERLIQGGNLYRTKDPLGGVKHYILSPPQEEAKELCGTLEGYRKLKAQLVKLLNGQGFHGGTIIFHSHRTNKRVRFAPHFHIVGYGSIMAKSNDFYAQTGWIYKNKGHRKSVYHTIQYQLSHCGVLHDESIKMHHITWFGKLSYNKVVKDVGGMEYLVHKLRSQKGIESAEYKPSKKVVQITKALRCPVCMAELVEVDDLTGIELIHFEVRELVLYRLRDGPPPPVQEVLIDVL